MKRSIVSRNAVSGATVRVVQCSECGLKKRERSESGSFEKFKCKCGSVRQPRVLQIFLAE